MSQTGRLEIKTLVELNVDANSIEPHYSIYLIVSTAAALYSFLGDKIQSVFHRFQKLPTKLLHISCRIMTLKFFRINILSRRSPKILLTKNLAKFLPNTVDA